MPSKYSHHWAWVIAGPNGAGKSSCRNSISSEFESLPSLDLDWTARYLSLSQGVYSYVSKEQALDFHERAGQENYRLAHEYFRTGQSFTVEHVIASLPLPEKVLHKHGWKIGAAIVGLATPELSEARVGKRMSEGGHAVALMGVDIKEAWDISAHHAASFLQICDEALILDNSEGKLVTAALKPLGKSVLALTPEGMQLLRSGENKYLETVIYESGYTLEAA